MGMSSEIIGVNSQKPIFGLHGHGRFHVRDRHPGLPRMGAPYVRNRLEPLPRIGVRAC